MQAKRYMYVILYIYVA